MQKYTGANLKARVMIALAENPMDSQDTSAGIMINKDMNEFSIHFSLVNISYCVSGILPLDDLPEIHDLVQKNRDLQNYWTLGLIGTTEKKRESMLKAAQPGLAKTPHLTRYLESIRDRAQHISGISRVDEAALYEATDDWADDWAMHIEHHATNPLQVTILRNFRAMSNARVLIHLYALEGTLPQFGDLRTAFYPKELEMHIGFANDMAYQRAFFVTEETDLQPRPVEA